MGFSLTWGPFHPDLERSFLDELKRNRDADPMAPLTVLVPNFQLVRHLRRLAAHECGAHFNLRFETLALAVDRATGMEQVRRGTRMLQDVLKPWVLQGLANQVLPSNSPLRALKEEPGLFRALSASLDELRLGGFTPETMEEIAPRVGGLAEASEAREWAAWMREYAVWKSRHLFHDREDLLETVLKVPVAGGEPVWVYGFYDANALQRKALLHLAGRAGDRWFVPYQEQEAYEYARPFQEWAGRAAGSVLPAASVLNGGRPPSLERLNRRLFDPPDMDPEGSAPADDGSLQILLAPGGSTGMEEGARLAIAELERQAGSHLPDAACLIRFPDSFRRDVVDAFQDLGIPFENRLRQPVLSTPPGKAACLLMEALDSDLSRGPFMDLVACPAVDPKGFGVTGSEWNPAGWDLLTKELKHIRGAGVLVDRLRGEVRRIRGQEEEERPDRFRDAQTLLKVTLKMADLAARVSGAKNWEAGVHHLATALGDVLIPSKEKDELVETLEGLDEMEGKGGPFVPKNLSSVVRTLWDGLKAPSGETTEGGVRFLDLMESRGLSFDVVIVPGLAEGGFPPPLRPDPLLPDGTRERYNAAARASEAVLPLKASSREEERLLFTLAVGCARRSLILMAPLTDPGSGDERNPSSYLYEVLEAVTGRHHPKITEAIEGVRVVRGADRDRRDLPECLTTREVLSAALRRARGGRGSQHAQALASKFPFAADGARLIRERQVRRAFTPFDGAFKDPEAIRALSGADGMTGAVISASRIETYATCPLKYFYRYVLGLEPVGEPEDALRADPMERGRVLHAILETAVREGLKAGWWEPSPGERDEKTALAFLEQAAKTGFDAFEKDGITGAPALWRADRRRHLSELKRLLVDSLRDPEWNPLEVEKSFGVDGTEAIAFPLESGEIKLRGRIDRVDLSVRDGLIRIVDYKTGRPGQDLKDDRLCGGTKIQLALYLWAARGLYPGKRPVEGLYQFFTEEGGFKSVRHRTPDDDSAKVAKERLAMVLGTVADGVSRGLFPGMAEDCAYCDFKVLCGVEQEKRRERKIGDARVKDILAMGEIP